MTKINDKGINYVQTALKQDEKNNPKRSIKEFAELVNLIRDQFDDNRTTTIKRKCTSKDVLEQNDTISLEELE